MSDTAPVRWRSRSVDLRLLGTAGSLVTLLAGCSSGTYHRNVYNSGADCAADYSLSICNQHGSPQSDRFLGPMYRMLNGRGASCDSRDPGPGPLASRRVGVEPVVRGGFACRNSRRSYGSRSGSRSFFGS